MLKTLSVRNFALVDALEIHFGPGLTVVTGESGAGKSILLGALGLVLGERASTDMIRPGTSRAEVNAEFDLSAISSLREGLQALELDDPDQPNRALVRRVVSEDGRSRAFLNGSPVTLQVLRELTGNLIDVHGQHENQRLAEPETQLSLLDDFGVDSGDLSACRDAFRAWKSALARLDALQQSVSSQEDRASLLSYQLEELSQENPRAGEFEQIESSHKRLTQAQHLKDIVSRTQSEIDESTVFGHALRQLERIDDDHPALNAARDALSAIVDLSSDVLRELRDYEDTLDGDPKALEFMEERLAALHTLARKHRVEPERLPELMAQLQAELDGLSTDRSTLAELAAAAAVQEAEYRKRAARISRQRRAAADRFASGVSECMNTLGIQGGALVLNFEDRESEHGLEGVEFYCITNPKYPPASLARIASGGERSRISLAIQIVAARSSQLPSLILDEADVGVGGTTADVVGRLLRALAGHTQVICVTHAPQVAALGQHHLRVHKGSEQDTRIQQLDHDHRVDELARMLAGSGITDKSRDYARTLLAEAADAVPLAT
ncbi:MAG: DNA repair protein RecN [Pseudomonadales bacterium]|nr:DNA repair protein RecN [Pseudomonadales bacterium]